MNYASLKRFSRILLLVIVMPIHSAIAGPYADALGKRLVSSTTADEKTVLVQWMFASMSLHPAVKDMASVTPQRRAEVNRAFGKLVTRLLTETCVVEAREAVKYEGTSAIESAFQLLGQVAARELFGHPDVAAGLADLGKVVDSKALMKALTEDPSVSKEKKK